MSTEGAARLLSAELARHATFVYSNEGLTSNAGRNWRRKAADIEKLFSLETMARHHPRVIFIYRSVSDFLWSTFRHEVFHRTEDGGRSYVQFLRSEIELARRREASFLFGDICERYDAFLPEGRLFVADLADVSKKPRDVNSALSAFLGIDRLDELVPALTKKRNETNRKYRTKKPEAVDRVRQELHHREIQTLLDEVRAIETAQLVKLRRIAERHA